MKRRGFLLTAVSTTVVGLSGCSSNDDGGSDDENDGGNVSDDTETPANESNDENGDDDGGNGSNDTETPANESNDENGGDAEPTLGMSYQWEDSFAAEIDVGTGQASPFTIYFNGGNYRQVTETPQGTVELYNVDDEIYQDSQQGCVAISPEQVPGTQTNFDPQNEEEVVGDQVDISPSGRETIDGEEMYTYEYTIQDTEATMYVSVETGYVRRVELPQGAIDYHSWGEVDPIEPPEGCTQINQ